MIVVTVQQAPPVPIASVEDIFEPHVGASGTAICFTALDVRSPELTYPFSSVEKPWQTLNWVLPARVNAAVISSPRIVIAIPGQSLVTHLAEFSVRMEYQISISPCEWREVRGELAS